MPITVPVPEEYAKKFDAKHPVEVRPVRRLHRPVHGQERPQDGQAHRPRAGQVDRHRPQPQLGQVDRLPSRLPRRDQDRGGQRRPGHGRAPRAQRLGHGVLRRRLAAGPGAQAGRPDAARTRCSSCRRAARATSRSNTTVKPFDNINVRKAIIAASDRNALRLTRGGEILGDIATGWIPPGIPGFDEAGGLKQNDDLDYLKNPQGDPAVSKKYMLAAKKQDPSLPIDANGKWTGEREDPHHRHERRPGQEDRRGLPGPDREARASSSTSASCLRTRCTRSSAACRKAKVPICPNVGWFKDFADPQSMLDADVQRQQHPRSRATSTGPSSTCRRSTRR